MSAHVIRRVVRPNSSPDGHVITARPMGPSIVLNGSGMPAASNAETIAGTSSNRAVTPAALKAALPFIPVGPPSGDTSGVTDDAAIAAARAIAIAAGGGVLQFSKGKYYVTATVDLSNDNALYNAGIAGVGDGGNPADASPHGTQIVMLTSNIPIVKIWGAAQLSNICLIYNTQQTTSNTAAIGVSMNNLAAADLHNVRVWRAHISYGIPQSAFGATSYNAIFNSSFVNLNSNEASKTHYDFRNFSGGGTNCRLGPLYVNGGGSLDFVTPGQSCDYAIRGANWLGWELGAISIDGVAINERALDVATGNNYFTIDTIRTEAVDWNKDNDGLFGFGGSDNICSIRMVELKNTKWTPGTTTAMYVFRTNATRNVFTVAALLVGSDCDFGVAGTRRALINGSPDAGSAIRIGSITDTDPQLSDTLWGDSISTLLQPVREWNGSVLNFERRAGRSANTHRVFVATAIPTTGTFATDDELQMDIVSATDPVCAYRCTAGGTPGTWRAIAWIVNRGTTASRPTLTASDVGVMYLDNTLDADGKPIWWNGTAWVDATGATV